MDLAALDDFVGTTWNEQLIGELTEYITIPALSPAFDVDWESNGHIRAAVDHIFRWINTQSIVGMTSRVVELAGRTPVIVAEIPAFGEVGQDSGTVLLYGHCDKQPEMIGWEPDLGPWKPVRRGERLYGRGGADDGYAAYASLTAIKAVQESGGSHPRCVLLIEASEESGSPDLPAHVKALSDTLGDVGLVVCLDSGCANYDTLWLTSSLRGMAAATLTVDVLTEGVHSGASGVVPSSFRIMRQLLDRIENASTGAVLLESANTPIPEHRVAEAQAMDAYLGHREEPYPWIDGVVPMSTGAEAQLNKTWRPTVSYIGADGFPLPANAGNVLRPSSTLRLSLRMPPSADADAVVEELVAKLTANPPSNARVTVDHPEAASGWNAPDLAPWLKTSLDAASQRSFGEPLQLMGEGGTIPFMGMLGDLFPKAQFAIMGVLGPESNAHGPNEFLHLTYAQRLTSVLASLLNDVAGARP